MKTHLNVVVFIYENLGAHPHPRLLLYKAQFGIQHNLRYSYTPFQIIAMFYNNFQWLYGVWTQVLWLWVYGDIIVPVAI